ncbi:hypothetical protein RSSM_06097 [Rhodopirellula sallentina SM41]|uniref:Uncharacterized protein n=1 Tax=Rhodopirellula sallentina SM41 TaxID=1263870 RepID=M5TTU2_9BACT|nr:hypothetical protein RSSM_06097 [Rhodopirellula sallentina SM41]
MTTPVTGAVVTVSPQPTPNNKKQHKIFFLHTNNWGHSEKEADAEHIGGLKT